MTFERLKHQYRSNLACEGYLGVSGDGRETTKDSHFGTNTLMSYPHGCLCSIT